MARKKSQDKSGQQWPKANIYLCLLPLLDNLGLDIKSCHDTMATRFAILSVLSTPWGHSVSGFTRFVFLKFCYNTMVVTMAMMCDIESYWVIWCLRWLSFLGSGPVAPLETTLGLRLKV